ncbi:hypothetical protein B0H11DRAFT_389923 [Mycena galericulata]|nr:hypothetical protein B0H11DRAFT_389923 [Mycena galericulata]
MTQNPALPVADPIPHCLAADLILDKAAGNWITWQKAVLACLTVVGLEGYVTGSVPCPDPASDPAGARNWQTNDRAVVSFLTFMVSRSEQPFVAGHASAGAKAVWDALVARHFDPSPQIRLIREAFGVRYGGEPAAATSARIDVLATRIFALGPISKATLVSAMMVNAVQGDFSNLAEAGARASSSKQPQTSTAEQNAIAAITNEASTVKHELSPAVTAFVQNPSTNEAEWTRLLELLFQVLGRVDAIPLAPEWDRANAARQNVLADIQLLQNMLETSESNAAPDGENAQPRRVSEGEQNGLAAVATEMANVQAELAPAVTEYLQQQEPDPRQRTHLIELLVQTLVRLDGTSMHLDWEEGRTRRKRAVNEVLRLLNTLEWSPVSEPSPGHTLPTHTHTISPEEQGMIDVIAAELSNVQNVLAPAVATFPRSSALQTAQKERKYLSSV